MLAEHFPQTCRQTWEPRSCQGCAGVDSWSSDEIRFLPDDAISDFCKFACRWGTTKQFPSPLQYGKMTSLQKPGKNKNHEIAANDLRPITSGDAGPVRGHIASAPYALQTLFQHASTEYTAVTVLRTLLAYCKTEWSFQMPGLSILIISKPSTA